VIIAHRLSTILHADKIAVLDQGKLVATGTHSDLLQSCDLYSRLASLQFRETDISDERAHGPVVEPDPYVPG
jgi:ATP-binding cassette subfamily B protein